MSAAWFEESIAETPCVPLVQVPRVLATMDERHWNEHVLTHAPFQRPFVMHPGACGWWVFM